MPITITMPALSPTMTEGGLARWIKKEGDPVKPGEVLAEIETDKATMEIEAVDEGVLGKILIAAGTPGVKVNTPIAILVLEGEDASAATLAAPPPPPVPHAPAAPTPPAAATPATPPPVAPPAPTPAMPPAAAGERLFASPLARRMAAQAGLDLSTVAGSGPHGRIVKADIERALAAGPVPAAPKAVTEAPAPAPRPVIAPSPIVPESIGTPYELVPHSSMRRAIARRLTEAKQTIPHIYLTIDCTIDALSKLRAELNAKSPPAGEPGAFKLSVNDFVVRACALALRQVPAANVSWTEEGLLRYARADVAVAVALPAGLITPIVRGADAKGLASISSETKSLAARAKEGRLQPPEYEGGCFTVTNLGMFGIRDFAAIINPPQGAILAVGAGEERPVVKGGALGIATVMTCTLSADHRAIDGAVAAEWLAAFKRLIEDPMLMML